MASSDADYLAASLAGLSGMLTKRRALEETLVSIAGYAVQAIPGAQGVGLTLLESDRAQTVVATADFVRAVDDVQYALGEGPCLSAVEASRTFTSGNLGGEPRWPRFGPRVGRMGVHSALSLPLLLPGQVIGALSVYAHGKNVFDTHAIELGETFARSAAVSVANAQQLADADRLIGQLREALTSRAEIDQALGVVMSRTGLSATEAFTQLRTQSQSRSMKLADVARDLLGEATRRPQARHTEARTGRVLAP